jgi:hypothetical protein
MDEKALNTRLAELAREIYGEKVTLRAVDPRSIVLLKKNARFMKKATFDQLTSNLKADGVLQSVPLCHTLADGRLECLSGNHRVQAAIKAGLAVILCLVIPTELPKSQRLSRQLSHNALSGEDDMTILADLWKDIESLEEKLYAGLDSELIGELQKINFQGFAAEPIRTEQLMMWFLPEEVADLKKLLEVYQRLATASDVYLAPLSRYETLWKALVKTKRSAGVKNTAVAFMLLVDKLAQAKNDADALVAAIGNPNPHLQEQGVGSTGEPGVSSPGGPFDPVPTLQPDVLREGEMT